MAFYFILSCCWNFGGKNSKNSLEFCLHTTVDLEELHPLTLLTEIQMLVLPNLTHCHPGAPLRALERPCGGTATLGHIQTSSGLALGHTA